MSVIPLKNQKKVKKSTKEIIFTVLRQISYTNLFKKYTSGKYSFLKISINHLIFSEDSQIVARFKDFLIYDDNTEFIRRFYPIKETNPRLKKILTFYETYSKVFPNYLVLKENKYLYRNIRKKQKMINAINEIKKEEKENKKKLGIKSDKNINQKNKKNVLFTKKVKDEIKLFQKNLASKMYKNSFDTDNKNDDDTLVINSNSISISILNWKQFEEKNFDKIKDKGDINVDSFITNKNDESITKMLNILNDNKIYTKDLPNIFLENRKALSNRNNKKKNININNKKNIHNHGIKNCKNDIYKCVRTSSNATTSSSIMSRYINKKSINSAKEEKNNNYKNVNNNENNNQKIISKINTKNKINKNDKNNLYQPFSPQKPSSKYKNHFFVTNNNFNKLNNLKSPIMKTKTKKLNKLISNTEKKEFSKPSNNYGKLKYTKTKQNSQDLNNKNEYLNKVYTLTNNNANKFLSDNNPNLITGDMIEKDKYFGENKVHVNLRDIIKNNKKIFNTAKKPQKSGGLILSLSKNNIKSIGDNIKFPKNKSNKNINPLANLNCNKYNFTPNQITEENKDKKDTNYMTKDNKSKTKSIFEKEKKDFSKNKEVNTNSKINNLKKKTKILNKRKNNILTNNDEKIIENYYSEKLHSYGNINKTNINNLTPFKYRKINNSKTQDSKNKKIKIDNNIIKTLSNEQRPYKYKTFLKNKIRSKSSNSSNKNLVLLHRIQSTKNTKNKIENILEKERLIKTPNIKIQKMSLFQKSKTINTRKFSRTKNINEQGKQKEKSNNDKKISSYTIKVNKGFINRKKNLVLRNNNINYALKSNI